MDSIRDKQGLVYGIMSHFDARLDARLILGQFPNQHRSHEPSHSPAFWPKSRAIREAPVSDQELAEAKSFLMGSFPLRLDSTAKLAQVLAQVEFYGLGFEYFYAVP